MTLGTFTCDSCHEMFPIESVGWDALGYLICPDCDGRQVRRDDNPTQAPRCEVCQRPISHPGLCADCQLSLAEMASLTEQNERRDARHDLRNMEPLP